MPDLASQAALWFLIPAGIICFIAAFNDLKKMKLPNVLVGALAAVYIVMGPFLLPLDQYAWGFLHFVVMYGVGMFLFIYAGVGAGDGKFAAAMSMFIPAIDWTLIVMIFAAYLLTAFFAHRALRAIKTVQKMTPDWISWQAKKFPMGLALAGSFIHYLALAAFTG